MANNYLYNGIELPALPEWDKTTYPYAFIFHSWGYYRLILSTAPLERCYTGATYYVRYKNEGQILRQTASSSGWGEPTAEDVEASDSVGSYEDIWTNTDILNEDGIIYLAATEPVPVGGGEPIDPTSFMQCYIVGRRLAGMRK